MLLQSPLQLLCSSGKRHFESRTLLVCLKKSGASLRIDPFYPSLHPRSEDKNANRYRDCQSGSQNTSELSLYTVKHLSLLLFAKSVSICVPTPLWYFIVFSAREIIWEDFGGSKHKRKHMVLCLERQCQSHHCRDPRKCVSDSNWFHETSREKRRITFLRKWGRKKY